MLEITPKSLFNSPIKHQLIALSDRRIQSPRKVYDPSTVLMKNIKKIININRVMQSSTFCVIDDFDDQEPIFEGT